MKIEIIGRGPVTPAQLDEIFFGTSTVNRKSPLEEAMDKLINEVIDGKAKTIVLDSLGDIVKEVEKDAIGKYNSTPICFDIQSITANHKKNAFTVVWGDGSHTIVHLQKGDVWDDEKALAMCFVKHMMGDKGSFNDIFTEELPAKIKHIGKVEPVEEKCECKCDTSCKDCTCHTEAEKAAEASVNAVLEKMGEAAEKNTTMKKMIDALTGDTANVEKAEKTTPDKVYKVYTKIGGASHFDGNYFSIEALRNRVHEIAESIYGRKPYYYRTWIGDNGRMIIDFGHYTKFIEVEGITPSEYATY